jgi:hypothetical protein
MAVANTKSTAVSNSDATQPRVINPSYLAGGSLKASIGMCEVAAADDNASVYRCVRLPSNAVIHRIEVLNDAITAGTDYDVGVYTPAIGGGAVVSAAKFASAIDMSSARALPLDAMFEVLDIAQMEKRLWEHLSLSADPMLEYDICFTANTVGSAAGTIAMRVYWAV